MDLHMALALLISTLFTGTPALLVWGFCVTYGHAVLVE